MIAPSFKHHSFAEEREWRLIRDPTAYVRRNVDLNTNHQYDVRVAGTGLVPYYKLPLSALGMKKNKQYLGFDFLFIGPHYDTEKVLSTVNDFFSWENVYRPYVSHSESPYRRSR